MNKKRNKRFYLGVGLFLMGMVILLEKMEIIPGDLTDMLVSWQMIIIIIGLVMMRGRRRNRGIILIGIGGFFMLTQYVLSSESSREYFWPVLLMVAGLSFIYRQSSKDQSISPEDKNETFDDFVIFGGKEIYMNSSNLKMGQSTSLFGGIEYDMRDVRLSADGAVIDCMCLFGGIGLRIPPDWMVKNEITTVFGAFSDKRSSTFSSNAYQSDKVLIIRGTTVFGGIEVKY